ncbi:GAF domain-containing protein [filamentous cyanobacterium LEGE 11480]|uniref:histidine kinase n=1 Tax=Romeriopsis navalis LEGE 11480 TaxID=2777977 RepID=A0A928VNX5_9CYAN|nr:GAF domain-containing protein [Romeriopsis navalis]MBE9031077.1 GAF domain-containing protein [Romeriopsis navalis LEGE 11480]
MESSLPDLEDASQLIASSGDAFVGEIPASPTPLSPKQQLISRVLGRIRETVDLDTILQLTVEEVRQVLDADRVGLFRFYPDRDWEGALVVEDVRQPWTSALEKTVQDHCFSQRFAAHYQAGRINVIHDIYAENYTPCYLQLLEAFQVRANIVAPLRCHDQLWGLLCIHQCGDQRDWLPDEIDFVQQVSEQMSIALQQADALRRIRAQATELAQAQLRDRASQQRQAINAIVDKIRRSLDLDQIFQTTTEELRHLLGVDRMALYRFNPDWTGEFVCESVDQPWTSLITLQHEHAVIRQNVDACVPNLLPLADSHIQVSQGGQFAQGQVVCVRDDVQAAGLSDCYLKTLQLYQAQAYMIVSVYQGEKLWGLFAAFQNSAPRHWEADEIDVLMQVGGQFGIALQQAETLHQVKTQAADLAKAAKRQKSLAKTINQIRQSLDIDTIFQVTTQEVQQLLNVDRVAIYRFGPEWTGEFVADSMADSTDKLCLQQGQSSITCLLQSEITVDQYPRHESFVPILQGDQLWGLLLAYQQHQPRCWSVEDNDLLAQVGGQLGIALQQAELLAQTRRQTTELTQTLRQLRRSQSQLIQGEKMASLGQMVAGVAHEINNPNNFILGNLKHFEAYTQEMIQILTLYGLEHTTPSPELAELLESLDLEFLRTDAPQAIKSMIHGGERIRRIVQSLRTFSHLDQSSLKQVNLHKGIKSALAIVQHRLKLSQYPHPIQVLKQFGDIPLVECLAADINQVFLQLINNAIDALHRAAAAGVFNEQRQPTITLTTHDEGDGQVAVMIVDNGLGMTSDVQAKIFDPFFTTKAIGNGVGLGLSTSYQIITQRHGGELYCASTLGAGTEFFLRIPVAAAAAARESQ